MPYSRANGLDIWYEVAGDGPAMVLVHANPFDHDLWMYQTAHFSTWFKVIGIDIRGYGRSAKVTTSYTLKDMCDDVLGVMRDLGVERACSAAAASGRGLRSCWRSIIPTSSMP
jgi:pimeloyl-ACP methyl ester carboxylesterase